jgi:hypothetical protein
VILIASFDISAFFNEILQVPHTGFPDLVFIDLMNSEHRSEIFECFAKQFVTMRLDTDESFNSPRFQLLRVICGMSNSRDTDFVLIWLLILSWAMLSDGKKNLSQGTIQAVKSILNAGFSEVFRRFSIEFDHIVAAGAIEPLAQALSKPILELGMDEMAHFFSFRRYLRLKRASPATLIDLVLVVLVCIFEGVKESNHAVVATAAQAIAEFSITGKDESCRAITAHLAGLWTVKDLRFFDGASMKSLLVSAMRSLIKLTPETQMGNLAFLSLVIEAAPPDLIRSEQARILNALTRAFEFQPIDRLLDTIAAIATASQNIDAFNNMSQISVPRLLTLTVSETRETREKACDVLWTISMAAPGGSVVDGLATALGLPEVASLASFFLDWASKGPMNELKLRLLKDFGSALRADPRLKADFGKKVTPIVTALINEKSRPEQMIAVEISAVILT